MNAKTEYRVEVKVPKQEFDAENGASTSSSTVAKAYHGTRCIGRFTGIHAEKQAEALVALAEGGATEASLSLCAADIGRAALHEKSLKDHPLLLEV